MTRLIDADKLKEQFLAKCVEECAICKYNNRLNVKKTEYTCGLIDNAPTADDWQKFSDELWKNAYKEGYKQAIIDGKTNFSRPQGKWIALNEHPKNPQLWYKCNLCGAYYSPSNFCPNCGADMRKRSDE